MSLYTVPKSFYHEMDAGTPGWQFAPVPGWGINPYRAGPARIGVGAAGDQYNETTWGHVALVAAGALVLGVGFGVVYGRRSRSS